MSDYLDCTKSTQVRIINVSFLVYYCHIFGIFNPDSLKRANYRPQHRNISLRASEKGIFQTQRIAFRLIIGSCLKFLSSKII